MRKRSVQLAGNICWRRLQGWIDTLPEFWQPIASGASAIVAFMAVRGATFLLPIGVIYVFVTSSTPLLD
jgi:hypothetical protein